MFAGPPWPGRPGSGQISKPWHDIARRFGALPPIAPFPFYMVSFFNPLIRRVDCILEPLLGLGQSFLPIHPTGFPVAPAPLRAQTRPVLFKNLHLAQSIFPLSPFEVGLQKAKAVIRVIRRQFDRALKMLPGFGTAARGSTDGARVASL